jgi:hypothetical protein
MDVLNSSLHIKHNVFAPLSVKREETFLPDNTHGQNDQVLMLTSTESNGHTWQNMQSTAKWSVNRLWLPSLVLVKSTSPICAITQEVFCLQQQVYTCTTWALYKWLVLLQKLTRGVTFVLIVFALLDYRFIGVLCHYVVLCSMFCLRAITLFPSEIPG